MEPNGSLEPGGILSQERWTVGVLYPCDEARVTVIETLLSRIDACWSAGASVSEKPNVYAREA